MGFDGLEGDLHDSRVPPGWNCVDMDNIGDNVWEVTIMAESGKLAMKLRHPCRMVLWIPVVRIRLGLQEVRMSGEFMISNSGWGACGPDAIAVGVYAGRPRPKKGW